MPQNARPISDRFLTRVIYAGGAAVTVFLILLGWLVFRVQDAAQISIANTLRVESDLSQIVYLDLVLSGFARTAVTTGEDKWAKRYAVIEPKMAQALDSIFPVIPDAERQALLARTKADSKVLRDKEKLALSLLAQGLRKQAYDLLFSEAYDADRDANYQAMSQLGDSLKKYENAFVKAGRKELYRSVVVLALAFPVLLILGFTFYRLLNHWQTALRGLNARLARMLAQSEALVAFNRKMTLLNPKELARNAKETLPALTHSGFFSIFLLDPERKTLRLYLHNHAEWEELDPFVVPEGPGVMWEAVHSRQEIRLESFSKSKFARKDGERRYENDRAFCLPLLAGQTVVGVLNLNDLSDEAMTEESASSVRRVADHLALTISNISLYERNEQLVIVDELTQLYNRRFLYQELNRELERAKRYDEKFSILMTDLDHFKKINDTYGHSVGDLVLKAAAAHFRANLRPSDFACRFGGEEFVIILPKTGGPDAMRFAERIRQTLADLPVPYDGGQSLRATISMGVAEFSKTDTVDSLLARADTALYAAKEEGRNRCVFQPLPAQA